MTHRQLYRVSDTKLVITIPPAFNNKQVLITIADVQSADQDKKILMKQAAQDPLYLSDLKEVNGDFENIEHETL